jgi:ribosomal-protein-alanine N-acetyltransferase
MKAPAIRPAAYPRIFLRGKRLIVRPLKVSDFKALRASHSERVAVVNEFDEAVPVAADPSRAKYQARLKQLKNNARNGHYFVFGIFERRTERFVGQVDLFTLNAQLRWANLGYHLQNQFFGKGYAAEAGRLALIAAFEHLNFHRVESGTVEKNIASQKTALAIGLEPEGLRKKFFPSNGGQDLLFYATNAIDFTAAV